MEKLMRRKMRFWQAGLVESFLFFLFLVVSPSSTAVQNKSPETKRLHAEHPTDPTAWFTQVNVFFKSGEKAKAADLLHDAALAFPNQPDLAFNHAYVRFELEEHDTVVSVMEGLCGVSFRKVEAKRKGGDDAEGVESGGLRLEVAGQLENKWVDLLVKGYVKAGRVGDAVRLTDVQLRTLQHSDPYVTTPSLSWPGVHELHARVALNVYPWRFGAAMWGGVKGHYKQLKRAANLSLALTPAEVEEAGLRMTPHNSLIFLPPALSARVIRRHVTQVHPVTALNGTYARLRCCPECRYRISLRLGYLLWEVRESDVLFSLLAAVLQEHSRHTHPPEVRVYTLTRRPPPETLTFRGSVVQFISFSGVSGADAAAVIRRERTEVLLDLTTYGDLTGAHILRHLPAPLQAGFLGYPGPKLAPFINCSLWDRVTLPPEVWAEEQWQPERAVYTSIASMPSSHSSLFGRSPGSCRCGPEESECEDAGSALRRELSVPPNTTLLCNFLQTWKINPEVFGVWMTAMSKDMPDARLLLWAQSPDTETNLLWEAARRGVSPDRLRLLPRTDDNPSFHRRLCGCDLFLDTPFYNAGSTAPTVLWAGVPLLTLPGARTATRLASGFMLASGQHVGTVTVARNLAEYRRLMRKLGEREGKGWLAARRGLEFHRDNIQQPWSMFAVAARASELERAALLMRRLGAVDPAAASRYHLIVAAH